jgi:phospholipase D1/2
LSVKSSNLGVPTSRPKVHADDFEDPIVDSFWKEKWIASATHNVRSTYHSRVSLTNQ